MLLEGTYGVVNPLAPWPGFALMCGYAAFLIGLAALRLSRSDA
jgi:ABC-2 type transport system permease protein